MSESKVYGVNELSWYRDQAGKLIDRDRDLQKMRQRMDQMNHADYQPPQKLQDLQYFRTYRSAKPRDAIKAAVRVLSNFDEHIMVDPLTVRKAMDVDSDSSYALEMAGSWEKVMTWQMKQAINRRLTFKADRVRSAVLYDEICSQVIHLPTQIAGKERLGLDTTRQKQALQHGEWAIVNRNPQQVYVVESDYMVESVCSVVKKTAKGIVDSWGEAALAVRDAIEAGLDPNEYFIEYDWMDRNSRAVWCVKGEDPEASGGEDFVIVEPMALDYPVFPWSVVIGGSTLEDKPEFQREPLLMSVYLTEQWLTTNIIGSMMATEGISEFARPKVEFQGPGSQNIRQRFGVPGGVYYTGPLQKVIDHPRQGADPALRELFSQFSQNMDESTLSRILVTSEAQPSETFAGFNLRIQTALGQLIPSKKLIERAYKQDYRTFLLQAHYSGKDIRSYGMSKEDRGTTYVIKADWIDPENIYLEVEQEADVPIDKQAKINGAVMMTRELPVSPETVLEELGVDDPAKEMKKYRKYQFQQAYLQAKIQKIQLDASGELQRIIQEQVAAALQAQQSQANVPPGAPPGPPSSAEMVGQGGMGVPGQESLAGIGNNPNMGGLPAAMGNPEGATFEGATGKTRGGQEIVGGGLQ